MAASAATAGELGMSGNREHWDGPGGPDQQDPRDATLDLSRLIGILRPAGDDGGTASAGAASRGSGHAEDPAAGRAGGPVEAPPNGQPAARGSPAGAPYPAHDTARDSAYGTAPYGLPGHRSGGAPRRHAGADPYPPGGAQRRGDPYPPVAPAGPPPLPAAPGEPPPANARPAVTGPDLAGPDPAGPAGAALAVTGS